MIDGSPLVLSVMQHIGAMIAEGEIAPGRALPPERVLAQKFGVSRSVVRNAIQGLDEKGVIECRPGCRPTVALLPKVTSDVEQVTFKHVLLWMWTSPGHYMTSAILQGIQDALHDPEVRVVVGHANGTDWEAAVESEAHFLEMARVDSLSLGVITWYIGGERNLPGLVRLREAGVPVVFIDRMPPDGFDADFVGTDNEVAARRGVAQLIAQGHQRIGLVSNADRVSTVCEREAGYAAALKEAGIAIDPNYICQDPLDGPEGAEMVVDAYLALESPPTAIFAINDHMALQLYDSLRARGKRIPEDISLLGFDGLLRWVPGGGFLNSMCQQFQRIGEMAADLLVARSEGGLPTAFRHILLEAPMADQGSIGPAPSEQESWVLDSTLETA